MVSGVIFEPIRIGKVVVPNRVVRTAHNSFEGPLITEDVVQYHLARAKGGCGLTILQASTVHPSSRLGKALFDDAIVPGLKRLMDAVRPHGMRVFQQLWHGGNLFPAIDGGPPWAVSAIAGYTGLVGVPMDEDQIQTLIDAFVSAALRCEAAGLDGVELHAAHGYIFHQFLSPLYNDRDDRWGGTFENRSRFLMESLRAIRSAVPELALGVRLSASEAPGGVSIEDNQRLLDQIEAEALIDYLDVSKGDYYRMDAMVSAMHSPTGYELPFSAPIARAARVPRILAGRFRTLDEAEQVIRAGDADLVSMVRAQIADPDLVRKTREGRAEEVRPCIACNQGCWGGSARTGRIGCTVNPAIGVEETLSEDLIVKAQGPRKVLVVGGGPAGMEAARVAALAGHSVVLAEARPGLGGAINTAKRAPRLHTIGDIAVWLEQEVYRLGVEVRLGTFMDADDVRAESVDIVIVATGAMDRMDGFQTTRPGEPIRGVDQPHVVSSTDILEDVVQLGRTALVMDSIGHYESLAVVETLLTKGVSTTLVTHAVSMAPYVETTRRDGPALERWHRLARYGAVRAERSDSGPEFEILTRHRLIEIQPGRCLIGPSEAAVDRARAAPADTVVLITPKTPLRGLYDELRLDGIAVHLAGDARAPRDLQAAIADGHRIGRGAT